MALFSLPRPKQIIIRSDVCIYIGVPSSCIEVLVSTCIDKIVLMFFYQGPDKYLLDLVFV